MYIKYLKHTENFPRTETSQKVLSKARWPYSNDKMEDGISSKKIELEFSSEWNKATIIRFIV